MSSFSFVKRNFIADFVLFFLMAATTWAQTGTTSLHGVVTDKSGAAMTGVKVTLIFESQAQARDTVTSDAGEYDFVGLPPGTYVLSVEMPGFKNYEQRNLQLQVNTPATKNIVMELGVSSETVEVSAQAALVNTTDASLGIAFNENQIKQLPLEGRNIPDLLTLQAGVVYTGNRSDINTNNDTRSGSVNGARSDQTNLTLDGVDANDQVNGSAFTSVLPVTLDSVQEFRVTTTGYNADQGRSSGAQVSLVTKSGTNDFHGSAYEYHRNTVTSANDYFVKQAELANGDANVAPKLLRNIFGGSIGGPIKKNRLFFFANYEAARQRRRGQHCSRCAQRRFSRWLRDLLVRQCRQLPGGTIPGTSFTVPAGSFALSPTQLTNMDPLGLGPNSVVVNYLNSLSIAQRQYRGGQR